MKKFKPITQKDIAGALGLSASTISRVLNNVYGIGCETRKLVLDYIDQIEYYPNPIALKLKDRPSFSIGVVISEVANSYFSQVINGIESVAYERGYQVIITQTYESVQREITNIQQLTSQSIDGMLISLSSESQDTAHLKYLQEIGMPLVFFDRVPQDIESNKITVDNYKGAFKATEHLIRSGFRKIAHLTNSEKLLLTEERLGGYSDALVKHNIPFNPDYVFYCDYSESVEKEIENIVNQLMNRREKPDAIFSAGDRLSVACMMAINRLGFRISEDVGFVGFTNIAEIDILKSPITTVSQPAFEIGKTAAEMLIEQIESKSSVVDFETIMFETELNIREPQKNPNA